MSKLNILSIDFDVFTNIKADDIMLCYPDGVDLPSDITIVTWADKYVNPHFASKIRNAGIRKDIFQKTCQTLRTQTKKDAICFMTNSHVRILDMIDDYYNDQLYDGIHITHMDMHHDCDNPNEKPDCGNWVRYVKEQYPKVSIQWVAHPESAILYHVEQNADVSTLIHTDLPTTKTPYDLVFICRSDNWTPPHLDPYFDELKNLCASLFPKTCYITDDVKSPRDFEPIVKQLKDISAKYI